ncbi:MAG: pro-sigmaK processing inhibitor BofA family protein [Hespellia sp.]|nr:pro-sigmaK processing inhibitor BofA family protein [Hespellia sp.]
MANKFFSLVMHFIFRAIVGLGAIFLANELLASQGIDLEVGVNAVSLLTSGTLGIPGVALLYGIVALKFL